MFDHKTDTCVPVSYLDANHAICITKSCFVICTTSESTSIECVEYVQKTYSFPSPTHTWTIRMDIYIFCTSSISRQQHLYVRFISWPLADKWEEKTFMTANCRESQKGLVFCSFFLFTFKFLVSMNSNPPTKISKHVSK